MAIAKKKSKPRKTVKVAPVKKTISKVAPAKKALVQKKRIPTKKQAPSNPAINVIASVTGLLAQLEKSLEKNDKILQKLKEGVDKKAQKLKSNEEKLGTRIASLEQKPKQTAGSLKSLKALEKERTCSNKEHDTLQAQLSFIQESLTKLEAEKMALNRIKEVAKTSANP